MAYLTPFTENPPMPEIDERVGANLAGLVTSKGSNPTKLWAMTGIGAVTIEAAMRGEIRLTAFQIMQLLTALQASPADLYRGLGTELPTACGV